MDSTASSSDAATTRESDASHTNGTPCLRQLLAQLVAVVGAPLVELVDELIALEARLLGRLRALHSPLLDRLDQGVDPRFVVDVDDEVGRLQA